MKPSAIDSIVIHCSATPEGMDFRERDIDRMQKERGFKEQAETWAEEILAE